MFIRLSCGHMTVHVLRANHIPKFMFIYADTFQGDLQGMLCSVSLVQDWQTANTHFNMYSSSNYAATLNYSLPFCLFDFKIIILIIMQYSEICINLHILFKLKKLAVNHTSQKSICINQTFYKDDIFCSSITSNKGAKVFQLHIVREGPFKSQIHHKECSNNLM